MAPLHFLLIDISNSFTKIARTNGGRIGAVKRIATKELTEKTVRAAAGKAPFGAVVLSSVVPVKSRVVRRFARKVELIEVSPKVALGVGIDYPKPETIGPDRLANAAGAMAFFGAPCVVVDFGTAVTFDIISQEGKYVGGVIAPGLEAMTHYLHARTALLPEIKLSEPVSAIGKSTRGAMMAGAVHGYRGLVRGILEEIGRALPSKHRSRVIATGGYAELIAHGMEEIDAVEPLLTLEGLRVIGVLNSARQNRG